MKQSVVPASTWQDGKKHASPHARRLSAHERRDNTSVQKIFDSYISRTHTCTGSEGLQHCVRTEASMTPSIFLVFCSVICSR